MISTKQQRNEIINFIEQELLKRGFLVTTEFFDEVDGRFVFNTTEFQTVPVIFKKNHIGHFSSSIKLDEDFKSKDVEVYEFWMSIKIKSEYFGGGSNCFNVFDVFGKFVKDTNDILEIRTLF